MVNNRHNKQRARYFVWLLLPFVLLLSSLSGFAQEQQHSSSANQNEDDTEIICTMRINLAVVQVQVKTLTGLPVFGLTREFFAVYENKVRQDVEFFMVEESGIGEYKIGYFPTNNNRDGTYRKIRVGVAYSKQQGWKVRYTPQNYIAPIE